MALALAVGSLACPKPPAPPSPPPAPPALPSAPSMPAAPGAPPTPGESTARAEVRAPIVRLSVRVAESFPPQYFADVTSALPDGCSKFERTALRRDGAMLYVDVFNTQPASGDVACTMIYGEHESAVALGTDFVSGEAYTVDANGTLERFTAQ